jgi:23S rRNA (cytosine1962-C5)-methyltransferase
LDLVEKQGKTTVGATRVVGPETVRMLELGHPWVLADRYTRQWPGGKAGDLVALTDQGGRFLATALLDPADRVVARVLARQPLQLDSHWLQQRIEQASDLRRQHADLADSSAWRLVNGEGDGLPGLTVDCYGDYLLLQLYAEAWQPHLPLLAAALQKVLAPAGIYYKPRPSETRNLGSGASRRFGRLLCGSAAPSPLPVQENGLTFLVSLEEGLHTGLFPDQRRHRRDLMARAPGKKVLNLFAYTGAFSAAAAAAGAERVASVDASAPYLDRARENFEANRLNPKRHDFIVGDCFEVLAEMNRQKQIWDIILMDPPSHSTTGHGRFTTRRGTAELVAAALPLLADGGLLITSSNHQKVDLPDYLKELRRGALQAGAELRVVHTGGQPEDFPYGVSFPEGRYLKYLICVKG